MDSSIGGERSDQEKQKRSLGCKHRGFTFSAKETKIGNKKKGGKKRWTCKTFGLSNSGVVTKISFFCQGETCQVRVRGGRAGGMEFVVDVIVTLRYTEVSLACFFVHARNQGPWSLMLLVKYGPSQGGSCRSDAIPFSKSENSLADPDDLKPRRRNKLLMTACDKELLFRTTLHTSLRRLLKQLPS